MYGYHYIRVAYGLDDKPASPYDFSPGEPDDVAPRRSADDGVLAPVLGYVLAVVVIVAFSWLVGSDDPAPSAAGLPSTMGSTALTG